tara:strand:- start:398 stop:592 length:195 start_codon:yes stop_codon:yes gene_type:complete
MPDIRKYKSVAVPVPTWEKLWDLAEKNQRSPAQQISFLVDLVEDMPSDKEMWNHFSKKGEEVNV